jgi:peptidoglycan/LPS O-acetylase OafA/YrhL
VLESIQAAHLYFPQSSVGHFWSLAVEEQFYLVWPWVVLFLPRRALVWAVTGLIVCASAFRMAMFSLKFPPASVVHLPIFWLDALGLGALLALAVDSSFGLRDYLARARFLALLLGIGCLGLAFYLGHTDRHFTLRETIYPLGYSLTFVWLVSCAADGFKGPVGRLMSWKPLLLIGAISYGIYVFHFIIRSYSMNMTSLPTIASPLLRALVLGAISILIAAVSFYLYERPVNRLRRFFAYRAIQPAERPASRSARRLTRQPEPALARETSKG